MQPQDIVGRHHEMSSLVNWAAGPTPSVAYVHGVGGIGKSTLVREFTRRQPELNAVFVDATGLPTTGELLQAAQDSLLIVENSEQAPGTTRMFRDRVAPHLVEGSRLLLLSRHAPSPRWHADFGASFCALEVGELDEHEASALLQRTDVPPPLYPALIELCHGHPLMILLAAQLPSIQTLLDEGLETSPALIETLVEAFGGLPRVPRSSDAYVVSAIARRTTESLLQSALEGDAAEARALFEELRAQSWMFADRDGLFPHGLVRHAIRADAKWRDRAHYNSLSRAVARYSTERLRQHGPDCLPELMFLLADNPANRRISAHRQSAAPLPHVVSDNIELVDEVLGRHFDSRSVEYVREWHALGAIELIALYDADGEPSELTCHLDQTHLLETPTEDPAVLVAREMLEGFELRPDAKILFSRLHGGRASGQHSPESNSRIMTAAMQISMRMRGLAAVGSLLHPPEIWRPILDHSGPVTAHREVEIGEKTYIVHFQDLRVLDAAGWLESHLHPPQVDHPSSVTMLDYDEFGRAVREALKVLAGKKNATLAECRLASTPLVLRATEGQGPVGLAAAVELLLRSEILAVEDERTAQVLRATYLEPATKQYAAAAELGLSFSTFRRALSLGVASVIDGLWQREIAASS